MNFKKAWDEVEFFHEVIRLLHENGFLKDKIRITSKWVFMSYICNDFMLINTIIFKEYMIIYG